MENKEFWYSPNIYVSMFDNNCLRVTRYYPLNGNQRAYSGSVDVRYDGSEKDFDKAIKDGFRYIHVNKSSIPAMHGMDCHLGEIKTKAALRN